MKEIKINKELIQKLKDIQQMENLSNNTIDILKSLENINFYYSTLRGESLREKKVQIATSLEEFIKNMIVFCFQKCNPQTQKTLQKVYEEQWIYNLDYFFEFMIPLGSLIHSNKAQSTLQGLFKNNLYYLDNFVFYIQYFKLDEFYKLQEKIIYDQL